MITTTYLRLPRLSFACKGMGNRSTDKKAFLEKADQVEACVAMYAVVGAAHYWNVYRLGWTDKHWDCYFHRPNIRISFISNEEGQVVGYLELQIHDNASIEIVNFGLRPEFIGQGYGRSSLEAVLKHCADLGAEEVWLHTCSLDHPLALKNYYARGFEFVRHERTNYIPLDSDPTEDLLVDATWKTHHVKPTPIRTSNEQRSVAYHS